MPRWGAERRARPLHEVSAASVLSQGGKEKGRAPHRFSMRILPAPLGAPPPFFREEFFGDASWLGFSWRRQKLGCEAASRERKDSSSPGLTRHSSPPGLTRWSMGLCRTRIGPNCRRPFSIDHRVKPGGDEERGQDREEQTSDDAKLPG